MGEQRVAQRESTDSEKGYKNWKPELVKSMDILDVDPDLVWQKFGTFGRYQVW